MASRYNKEVMVVEVGGHENSPTDTYWTIHETINAVKEIPNGKGIGVFYWEPLGHSSVLPDGYPVGAAKAVSENVLQLTTAMDAFSGASGSTQSSGVNIATNPGFEVDGSTQNPSGWTTWSNGHDNANYTEASGYTGSFKLSHWKNTSYQLSTYQIKTGISNGTYTMKAWVKSSGGFNTSQMYVKNFGGTEKNVAIPATSAWTQMQITGLI